MSTLTGPRIVTSLSTRVVVSTLYDGEIVSSSSAVPVLVADDLLSTSAHSVGPGAIAGAAVGGVVFAVLAVLVLLGCCARRGPLRSLGVAFAGDEGFNDSDWAPRHHAEPDVDQMDVLPSEKDMRGEGSISEEGIETLAASRLSYVPHRSVSPETSSLARPLSMASSLSGYNSAGSLDSFHERQRYVDPRLSYGPPPFPPVIARRSSQGSLHNSAGIGALRPVETHRSRLYRASSSPALVFGAIDERDEDAGSVDGRGGYANRPPRESRPPSTHSSTSTPSSPVFHDAPLTPTDVAMPMASLPKRASTLPNLPAAAAYDDRRLSKVDAHGVSDGGRWMAPLIIVSED